MSSVSFRHQPLTAHGINASKSGWGHQVSEEDRWHTQAGAEDKGTFHRLFWSLMRGSRTHRGRAPVWVRLPFTFPAFLGSLGWCPMVFRQGSEIPQFPGKPVLTAEMSCVLPRWGARDSVGVLEIELGSFGARNSQESLEMIWKKIKNPYETHLFFYAVVVILKSSFYLIHYHQWRV